MHLPGVCRRQRQPHCVCGTTGATDAVIVRVDWQRVVAVKEARMDEYVNQDWHRPPNLRCICERLARLGVTHERVCDTGVTLWHPELHDVQATRWPVNMALDVDDGRVSVEQVPDGAGAPQETHLRPDFEGSQRRVRPRQARPASGREDV